MGMSNFPIFRTYNFPIFRFSNFSTFQFSAFPIFRLASFPTFQFSEFPIFQFSDFPTFRLIHPSYLFKVKSYAFFSKQGLSYRVFLNNNFSNFKLESDFFPPLLSKIRKLENYANIFILNYKRPNFQRNRRE